MSYKRNRTESKEEEANVSQFVENCINFETNVSFHAGAPEKLAKNIVLLGTADQLKDESMKNLPFFDTPFHCTVEEGSKEGVYYGTHCPTSGCVVRVGIATVPKQASRHNAPSRPDAIVSLLRAAMKDGKKVEALDIFARSEDESAIANAVARATATPFTAKAGAAEKGYVTETIPVRVFFPGKEVKFGAEKLASQAKYIQLCMRLVEAPTNLLDTTTFTEIAHSYAAKFGLKIDAIIGEDLRERGYGGVYGVGKAAEFPPALVTLNYKPEGGMDPKEKIAFVGKGIVFDTGGLAIKTPFTNMVGMKRDMGGSAAVFCGFLAAVAMKVPHQMSCTICLADNAIGPRAQRNDDIVRMKSGITVEINNTDAEGRLVLGDGVYHATALNEFVPDVVVEMATLTGAQAIATGKKHAAIFVDSDDWETRVLKAGKKCGDTCFPILFCPEYHNPEFESKVADYRNLMTQLNNAGVSCAGQFVCNNLAKEYKGNFVHVDLAAPSGDELGGTGFGVSLISQMFAY